LDASWTLIGAGNGVKTTLKQRENHGERPGGITGKGFLPGRSGNPQGRPRTAKFSDAARRLAEEIGPSGKTGAEQLAGHCFRQALKGSVRHAELFLAYTEGKPKQGVELSGQDGGAMKIENMSNAEIDARLNALLEKYREEKKG
jgi:hypothetical protein